MRNPFLRLMTDSAQWEAKTGLDAYGAALFAPAVVESCRWRQGPLRTTTATGIMILAADTLWMRPDIAVHAEDRFTLPDTRVVLVKIIDRAPGPRGEIYVTRVVCF